LSLVYVLLSFFFTAPATPEIYTLSLHDALPICDLRRDIVDDAADRGAKALVIEVLMIVRLRQVGRDQLHEAIVEAGVGALHDWDDEIPGRQPRLHVLRNEILQEIDCFLRRALGDEPAGDAAERIDRKSTRLN